MVSVDASKLPSDEDIVSEINKSSNQAGYIVIYSYHASVVKKAWYDAKNKVFFTPNFRESSAFYFGIELVGRIEDKTIYFLPKEKIVLYQGKIDSYVRVLGRGIIKPFINQDQVFGEDKEGVIFLLNPGEEAKEGEDDSSILLEKPILMGVTDKWLAKNKKSANAEETINHLLTDYPQHLETISFLGKDDGELSYYNIKKKMLIEVVADIQAKDQLFVGYDAKSNRMYWLSKYEGSTYNQDEKLFEESSKLIYSLSEEGNIKNFEIVNDSSDSAWIVNKTRVSPSQISLPLSPQSAYLNKDGSLTVTDEWGKVFLVSENEGDWGSKLLAVNQQWVEKNSENLEESLTKIVVTPSYSYTSSDIVDVFYLKESRGWYDKKNKKLVYVNDAEHENLAYIGVSTDGQGYLFDAKQKQLLKVEEKGKFSPVGRFNDCQRMGEMIYLQVLSEGSNLENFPLLQGFNKLMISNNGEKHAHLSKKILDHYSLITVDYFSNNLETLSKLKLDLPFKDDSIAISTYGSDWVIDYHNSVGTKTKVIITGYEDKKVTLLFFDKEVRHLAHSSSASPWEKKYKLEDISQPIEKEEIAVKLTQEEFDKFKQENQQLESRIEILPK